MNEKIKDTLEEEAKAAFRKILPSEWLTKDKSPEYSDDMEVEIVEGARPSGMPFWVHLEAAKRVRRHRGAISREVKTELLRSYEHHPLPVLLVHWTKSNGKFHCLFAQRMLQEQLSQKESDWRERDKIKLKFPADSEVKDAVHLKSLATDAAFHLVMQELEARPETCVPQYWLDDVPVSSNEELKDRTLRALAGILGSDYIGAKEELESMLRVCIVSPVERLAILLNLGNAHFALSNYREALRNYDAVIELTEKLAEENTKEVQSTAMANLGVTYFEKGDMNAALKYLQDAMTIQRDLGKKQREASALASIAQVHKAMSDLDRALKFAQHALRVAGESGSKRTEANQLCNVGALHSEKGTLETALNHLQDALRMDEEIGYRSGRAHHLGIAGTIHKTAGDLDSALNYIGDALSIDREIGYRRGEADHLSSLALVYRAKDDMETALKHLDESLSIHRQIGYRQGEATTLAQMGLIHEARGDLDEALRYLDEGLLLAKDIEYKQGEANYLGNIGLIHFDKGNLEKALEHLQSALSIHKEIGYKQGEASGLGNIGLVYEAIGDKGNALKYLEDALSILVEFNLEHGKGIIENAIRELQQQKDDMQ